MLLRWLRWRIRWRLQPRVFSLARFNVDLTGKQLTSTTVPFPSLAHGYPSTRLATSYPSPELKNCIARPSSPSSWGPSPDLHILQSRQVCQEQSSNPFLLDSSSPAIFSAHPLYVQDSSTQLQYADRQTRRGIHSQPAVSKSVYVQPFHFSRRRVDLS